MGENRRNLGRHRAADDAADDMIRRRFSACQSLPLFGDPPLPPGFFQPPDVGPQLHLHDPWRAAPPTRPATRDSLDRGRTRE